MQNWTRSVCSSLLMIFFFAIFFLNSIFCSCVDHVGHENAFNNFVFYFFCKFLITICQIIKPLFCEWMAIQLTRNTIFFLEQQRGVRIEKQKFVQMKNTIFNRWKWNFSSEIFVYKFFDLKSTDIFDFFFEILISWFNVFVLVVIKVMQMKIPIFNFGQNKSCHQIIK